MQRRPERVYVVMPKHEIAGKRKPDVVYNNRDEALEAFWESNKTKALRFGDYVLVEAECSENDFNIINQEEYLTASQPREQSRVLLDAMPGKEIHRLLEKQGLYAKKPLSPLDQIGQFLKLPVERLPRPARNFLDKLATLLPPDFYNLDSRSKCRAIYQLRENSAFMTLLNSHWQMAVKFMDACIDNNQDLRSQLMSSRRLAMVYKLNNLRRDLLPDDLRERVAMRYQQDFILGIVRPPREPRQSPAVQVPILKEGLLTKKIEAAELDGEIKIPEHLICPISGSMFKEPVVVNQNGKDFFFEKAFILEALKQKSENPLTRLPLSAKDLQPAPSKAAEVVAFKSECKEKLQLTLSSSEPKEKKESASPKFKR